MSDDAARTIPTHRKVLFLLVLLLFLLALAETGSRLLWSLKGLSFGTCPRHLVRVYYPTLKLLRPSMRSAEDASRDSIDVLILGGSTVTPHLGAIPTMLLERLTVATGRKVRVFDAADVAHTSRDSLFKYRDLSDRSFDLVLVYHGLNELRANNCPPEVFRDDYSHYQWYRELNLVTRGSDRRALAFPVTLRLMLQRAAARQRKARLIPMDGPGAPEWVGHGSDIKTARPFRSNFEEMLRLARGRGETVAVMTYAWYIPEGYAMERFEARQLDYVVHWFPVELWGEPANIRKGLDAHNAALRDLAREHGSEVLFVDQEQGIPKEGRYFNDVCHLSTEGCARFVENVCRVVEPWLASRGLGRPAVVSPAPAFP